MASETIYGIHAVDSLLRQKPKSIQTLWLQAERKDKRIAALLELAANQGVSVQRAPKNKLDAMVSGRHQGAVALANIASNAESDAETLWSEAKLLEAVTESETAPLLLILDGVTDPHNLGACMRSADAVGVLAVVVPKDNSASITDVVKKVACGAAEVVPFVQVTNIARFLKALQERGVWVYGADGDSDSTLYDHDLTQPVALVMGAEGSGLRRLTREKCDFLVQLPMAGSVGSLNVSVATGVCLFEVVRQRRIAPA